MDILNIDYLINWAKSHCKSKEELDDENAIAITEASFVLSDKLNGIEITTEPIVFDSSEFSSLKAFSAAMFMAADRFKDVDDIVVRYAKPENKATNEVSFQFHILKSKSKLFKKYMIENNESFEFALNSSNDIKSCVKFFNSLGVKGNNGEPISSKNTDYSKDMRDVFKSGENMVYVLIKRVDDMVVLEWDLMGLEGKYEPFETIKNKICSIF